ncbi:basic salivary proline-rich protein 4-like [Iris pallida]|uniref:Basic salivary proline-rich protein 4-like n=1 Tax=Iris pallida TaxID=29817 RepID=A0AAX6F405_IRIPA|nr:basic salivary proline-rich protein 4-like [Iris pallida]
MATNQLQLSSDAVESITSMSKSQLYELMLQMKTVIEQNHQQARQILVDNPQLTKALFQAQIMLGMVKPRPLEAPSEPQPEQAEPQSNVQITQQLPVQAGLQGQASSVQSAAPAGQQNPPQPSMPLPSASVPTLNFQSQKTSDSLHIPHQDKGFMNAQVSSVPAPHSSQIHNLSLPTPPAPPHYSIRQSHIPVGSSHGQPPLHAPGLYNQHLQPPLPQQPRPPMQPLSLQLHPQMPYNLGFQPSSVPHPHLSQSIFHSGSNPSSFQQGGHPPLPSQPPPQQFYHGGSHMDSHYSSQSGTSMQAERRAPWAPNFPENVTGGGHRHVPNHQARGHMAPGPAGAQPPRPPSLAPEMEHALLQQVMSLSSEQINLLPPEQKTSSYTAKGNAKTAVGTLCACRM